MEQAIDHTLWRYLLFLLAGAAFIFASFGVAILLGGVIIRKQEIKNRHVFYFSLGTTVIMTVFLILFSWVLTGNGHVRLFSVILGTSVAIYLLVELVCLILGASSGHWAARFIWMNFEYQRLMPILHHTLQIGSTVLMLVAYPVYIGIGFFGESESADAWTREVIRATLIVVIGATWILQLPQTIYMMVSRNVLEGTRARIFIARLGDSVSLMIFMSVFIWTIDGAGVTKEVFGEYFVFSSTIGYVIGGYVLMFLVVPYLVGHYRSKHWVEELQSKRMELIDEVTHALESLSADTAVAELSDSRAHIQDVLQELYEQPGMALAAEVASSDDPRLIAPRLGLKKSLKIDPRYVHIEHLEQLIELIDECQNVVDQKDDEKSKKEVLTASVKRVEKERKKDIGAAKTTKAWILIAISSLATSIVSPIITAVGKYITGELPFPHL